MLTLVAEHTSVNTCGNIYKFTAVNRMFLTHTDRHAPVATDTSSHL